MVPVSFHRLADAEVEHETRYYARVSVRAAQQFLDELTDTIHRIQANPAAWPFDLHGTRRCSFQRMPFSLVYFEEFGEVRVYAVANHRRNPGYWVRRLTRP